ncbi:MAG: hypothetical protein ACI8PZ_004939 [Myxococcota bacterium]|jgi:hypothetical protein
MAQSLSVDGACPGPATIDISGVTPGGDAVLLVGNSGLGSDVIPSGPCAGMATDLAGLRMGTRLPGVDDGAWTFSPTLADAWCGRAIQVLDPATCSLSEAVLLDGGPGDGGGLSTLDFMGYSGHLLFNYGIADEATSAQFFCEEAGFSSAADWTVEVLAPDPFTCWCYEISGEVRTPCCSGGPISIPFMTTVDCI